MTARLALRADIPALSHAVSQAFIDDPMIDWVMGVDDPQQRITAAHVGFFLPSARGALSRGHCYTEGPVGGPLAGGAMWVPPDAELFGEADVQALAESLVSAVDASALQRLMAVGELVAHKHPGATPHFYLFVLGAAEKGHGVGHRLMQPVLERCDLDGLPAYLESSSGRNVSFYERHGFVVVWEETVEGGGPVMRGMWREPGGPRG